MAKIRTYITLGVISLSIMFAITACATKGSYPSSITYDRSYSHERASSPTIHPVEPKSENAINNFTVKPKGNKYMGQKATAKKKNNSGTIRHKTLGQK